MNQIRPGLYRNDDGSFYVNTAEALQVAGIEPTPENSEKLIAAIAKGLPEFEFVRAGDGDLRRN